MKRRSETDPMIENQDPVKVTFSMEFLGEILRIFGEIFGCEFLRFFEIKKV